MTTKGSTKDHPTLESLRGNLQRGRANARSIAALTSNPGCTRRRVLDAAAVRTYEVAEQAGFPPKRGQSPFAISSGVSFEARLKERSDYWDLVKALEGLILLPKKRKSLRISDLGGVSGKRNDAWLRKRVKLTDKALSKIARGDSDAPHIVDHPVLELHVGGAPVWLEPDALAFRDGKRLELVEIKSYAVIDDQADPGKLSATASQAAVYLIALKATLERLGHDPSILRRSFILVAPKNFARYPTAHRIPIRKKVAALERVIVRVPSIVEVLRELPAAFTLDIDPEGSLGSKTLEKKTRAALGDMPHTFVPECLGSCDLAQFCRAEAIARDDPARLGRNVRDALAGVETLKDALDIARGKKDAPASELDEMAKGLRAAYASLQRARSVMPSTKPKRAVKATAKPTKKKRKAAKGKSTKPKVKPGKAKRKELKGKATKSKTKAVTLKVKRPKAKKPSSKGRKG